MIFFRKLKEEIKANENIMKAKKDIEILSEATGFKGEFRETLEPKTFYHLTPMDLGKNVVLEPRRSTGRENCYINMDAILNHNFRYFDCISFGNRILSCLARLPLEKLSDNNVFYIYMTKKPIKAWRDCYINKDNTFTYQNEYRVFKKTECLYVGKIIIKSHYLEIIDTCFKTPNESQWKEVLKDHIDIIIENNLIPLNI